MPASPHAIQLRLREITQLFNSLDPSPFNEQDLDHDAEEFIVGWARELPRRRDLHLTIHLERPLAAGQTPEQVADSVRHYFEYRASINRLDLRQLFKTGRTSLLIGGCFLSGCLAIAQSLAHRTAAPWQFLREGLTIAGWVALWRPMEIYLYDWWPLQRRGALLYRLSRMKIDFRPPRPAPLPEARQANSPGSASPGR